MAAKPSAVRRTSAVLLATESEILHFGAGEDDPVIGAGLGDHQLTCLAAAGSRAWCGTKRGGVFRSDDGGRSWRSSDLDGKHVMSLAVSPVDEDLIWLGTEPSTLWRSEDGGESWEARPGLTELPSSSGWAFPPRPETHHVRWITCHPHERGRLWLAIEAGALVSTPDGGRSWSDRAPDGPRDTHEAAIHPMRPETLRIAAGDGYFESEDGGATWCSPRDGLDVTYLRSVAIDPSDPEVLVVSAASTARRAYVAGHSDGRLYRRVADEICSGRWARITDGWPEDPTTIAPLLVSGSTGGEIWAADERGIHCSRDGGKRWEEVAGLPKTPNHLRGLVLLS